MARAPGRRAATLAMALVACAPNNPEGGRARELEGRLLAPCCWVQTLDIHESELATGLRQEIRQRLQQGESSEAIEEDLAARHGERILAVPRGKDPRNAVPALLGVGMVATLAGLLLMLRRWQRASWQAPTVSTTRAPAGRDEYDERLDEELVVLDDT
jgi:cytochrome c-type biogenesis protein CcmH